MGDRIPRSEGKIARDVASATRGTSGLGCMVPVMVLGAIAAGRLLNLTSWSMLVLVLGILFLGLGMTFVSAFQEAQEAQRRYFESKQQRIPREDDR